MATKKHRKADVQGTGGPTSLHILSVAHFEGEQTAMQLLLVGYRFRPDGERIF